MACGHVCSCSVCALNLFECPLCRAAIEHKVDLHSNAPSAPTHPDAAAADVE